MQNLEKHPEGILPDIAIQNLIEENIITSENEFLDNQIQPASLDLRLTSEVYRIRASFLPRVGVSVEDHLRNGDLTLHRIDITKGGVLETGCVYLAKLDERLSLTNDLSAKCNPKSSTGRIDVFTRLLTDGGMRFDDVKSGYEGAMYLEIFPRTFSIFVRQGDKLAQIRLFRGPKKFLREMIFSVNLDKSKGEPVGWRARRHAGVIDFATPGGHLVEDYWEPVFPRKGKIVLNPEEFYILASKEKVSVPSDEAAEMAPIAPELGEFRAHYAGFFDPGFGMNAGGSQAVLEVRTRDVPFILEDRQPVGKLVFESMSAPPNKPYGVGLSNYQGQSLRLSKHFAKPSPDQIEIPQDLFSNLSAEDSPPESKTS